MTTIKAFLHRVAYAACAAVLLQAGAQAATLELNFATAYASDNFQTINLQAYADEVIRATDGKVLIKVHPAGTMIEPTEIFAAVKQGRAEGGEVILSSLAHENPLFGMDALPFIVSGYDDARHMWDASRPAIEKALNERGLQLLYAVPWPPQNLYSSVPITAISEFKGLRMRTYNHASKRIAELIHAKPVTIQVVDLEKAIADGDLDLMLTSSWTGVEAKAWQRLQHYYKVSAWIPKNIVFVNKAIFDKLDKTSQKQLLGLARTAEQRGWEMSRNSDQKYEDLLAAHNINVSTMDFFLRQYLDRIGETLAREWLKRAGGEELQVLLQYTSNRSLRHSVER